MRDAGEADLLLGDGERHHVPRGAALLRDEACRLGGDVATDPVIERARHQPVVGEVDGADVDHREVADAHELLRLVAVLGADVDDHVLELGCLLAVFLLHQVHGLAPDHPADLPTPRGEGHPLGDEDHRVPAAEAAEVEIAVVIDVGHVQADLVDVPDDREHRTATGRASGYPCRGRPDLVALDLGELGARRAPHLRGAGFVP